GGDSPPAPTAQLLPRQPGLQGFGHREWTVLELRWDDRVLRHQGRPCSSPRCKSIQPVKKSPTGPSAGGTTSRALRIGTSAGSRPRAGSCRSLCSLALVEASDKSALEAEVHQLCR